MSETSTSLSAAATDRKARLAQLKSLKRKQAPGEDNGALEETADDLGSGDGAQVASSNGTSFLSGRNYDSETRGPRLGFENAPTAGQTTLEAQAKTLAETAKKQAEEEEKADKPLDLFKLQPKKPNWDLKRDLDKKLESLNVRTDNAIARMVRERIENAKKIKGKEDGAEVSDMDGNELVEAMHMREREEEQEERREREEEEEEEDDDDED